MFEIIGYFGFTMMIVNGIYSIPGSLASVLYPDMLENFGKDKNASSLMDKIFPLLILTIITTSLITILFAAFLPLMINHFLIDYKDGQYLMTLILVTSIYFGSSSVLGNFLISVDKQLALILNYSLSSLYIFFGFLIAINAKTNHMVLAFVLGSGLSFFSILTLYSSLKISDRLNNKFSLVLMPLLFVLTYFIVRSIFFSQRFSFF